MSIQDAEAGRSRRIAVMVPAMRSRSSSILGRPSSVIRPHDRARFIAGVHADTLPVSQTPLPGER